MASQVQRRDILDSSKYAQDLFKALIDDTVVTSEVMLDKAKQKDPSTLCRIGNIYYSHENQEYQLKGFEWYLLSAESNYPESQYNIGQCYSNGLGVKVNYPLAMVWYKKAAENNYTRSFFKIGFLYHYGMGEAVDYKAARRWYVKAATFKDFKAEFNMGVLYEKGLSVTIDQNAATVWYSRSAMSGFHLAKMKIKHRMKKGIQPNLNYASVKSQQAFEELSMTEKAQEITQNKSDTRETLVDEKNQTVNMLSDGNRTQRRPLDNTSMASQKAEPMRRRQSKTLVELEEDIELAEYVVNDIRRVTNLDVTLDWLIPKSRRKTRSKEPQQNTENMSTMNESVIHPKPVNQQEEHTQSTEDLRRMLEQEVNEMMEAMEAEAEAKRAEAKETEASKKRYEESQLVSSTLEFLNEDNMVTHDDVIKSMLQDSDDMASCGTLSTDNSSVCHSVFTIPGSDAELTALIHRKLDEEYSMTVECVGKYLSGGDMYEHDGYELY